MLAEVFEVFEFRPERSHGWPGTHGVKRDRLGSEISSFSLHGATRRSAVAPVMAVSSPRSAGLSGPIRLSKRRPGNAGRRHRLSSLLVGLLWRTPGRGEAGAAGLAMSFDCPASRGSYPLLAPGRRPTFQPFARSFVSAPGPAWGEKALLGPAGGRRVPSASLASRGGTRVPLTVALRARMRAPHTYLARHNGTVVG